MRRSGIVLAAWILFAAIVTPGVLDLRVETSTTSILDRVSPEWEFYQSTQARFGGDEVLTLLLPADRPFEESALRALDEISVAVLTIDGIARADSLHSVPHIRVTEADGVSLEPMLADPPWDPVELAARLQSDRIAPRVLASDDGFAFAINLRLRKGAEPLYPAILAGVDDAMRGREGYVSGVPVFRVAADERTRREILTFIPVTVLLISALFWFLFRELRSIATPIGTTSLAVWLVMGVMGFSGASVTITTVALPSVLLALGCAYCMHFLNAAACRSGSTSLEEALESVALPVMLSGLTTAVGFVAISFVPIDAIRDVGAYGALGVLLVLGSAMTAVPAALRLWPLPSLPPRFHRALQAEGAAAITGLAAKHGGILIATWIVTLAIVGVGILRIHVETDVILWFKKDDPIRVAYDVIREKLVGISPVNVVIEPTADRRITEPDVLRAIADLTTYLEALPTVGRAISIADPIQQLHRGFVHTREDSIPSDTRVIEQYLLLLESKDYTRELLLPDHTAANIVLRVNDNGSAALLSVSEKATAWWDEHGATGFRARPTGIMFEFARAQDAITWGQIRGLALALGAIAVILVLVFRDLRIAALALVPNAVPVAMMFGAMGLMGVPIDAATVIVGNLALGIAVDDTIHVTTGFLERGGRTRGSAALFETLEQVLAPLVYTTATVAVGFLALGGSGFAPIRSLGLITASVVTVCLLADLFLLPALLLRREASRG